MVFSMYTCIDIQYTVNSEEGAGVGGIHCNTNPHFLTGNLCRIRGNIKTLVSFISQQYGIFTAYDTQYIVIKTFYNIPQCFQQILNRGDAEESSSSISSSTCNLQRPMPPISEDLLVDYQLCNEYPGILNTGFTLLFASSVAQ